MVPQSIERPAMRAEAALDRWFDVSQQGSTVRTEVVAGATTFLTMAYIVVVNAQILSSAGMPEGAVVTATCLSAGVASILMGIWGRLPVGLAPGMGTNAYFAYFVCGTMGVPWPTALGAVFLSGLGFLLLSAVGLRERLIAAIPDALKHGIAAGIGLFVAFVGLQNAGIVVDHPVTLVQLGSVDSAPGGVFVTGLALTTGLAARGVRGAFLLGIALTTALAMALGVAAPPEGIIGAPPSIASTFLALDLSGALSLGLVQLLFAFLFVDLFDTVATLVAVGEQGGLMVERNGRRELPGAGRALT
ncbi:MAG: NCS2 family permease, partial [Myxococcota bacterium]